MSEVERFTLKDGPIQGGACEMIEVEFTRPEGGTYVVVATVRIDDDGTVTSSGEGVDALTSVVIADRSRADGRLRFVDDPVAWVRSTPHGFRTPYLVPRVHELAAS